MAWDATVHLECDKCGQDETVELRELDETPDTVIDREGWAVDYVGAQVRVLCGECYEEENP